MAGGYIDQGPFAIELVQQAILMAQWPEYWLLIQQNAENTTMQCNLTGKCTC
jgi:hypothetical protein